MSFLCPECSEKSLDIILRLELMPDSRWDEITLQTLRCAACGFAGVAVYQESRRGALDDEIVRHEGYRVGRANLRRLERALKGCPEPDNRQCDCFAHSIYGGRDASGRWNALDEIAREGLFHLRR